MLLDNSVALRRSTASDLCWVALSIHLHVQNKYTDSYRSLDSFIYKPRYIDSVNFASSKFLSTNDTILQIIPLPEYTRI